jgi:hypothetical protein
MALVYEHMSKGDLQDKLRGAELPLPFHLEQLESPFSSSTILIPDDVLQEEMTAMDV